MGGGRGGALGGARDRRQQPPQEPSDRAAAGGSPEYEDLGAVAAPEKAGDADAQGAAADGAIKGCSSSRGEGSSAVLNTLDKRIAAMQKDLNSSLRKIGGKESEKFDLIFAILSELQSRQAKLEETVRTLRAQCSSGGGQGGMLGTGDDQHPAFGGAGRHMAGMQSSCSSPQGGACSAMPTTPMQVQFVPQVVMISSPTGMAGPGMQQMQYAVMSPAGAAMQPMPMPGQMAMQFLQAPPMPCHNGGMACGLGLASGMNGGEGCFLGCSKEELLGQEIVLCPVVEAKLCGP